MAAQKENGEENNLDEEDKEELANSKFCKLVFSQESILNKAFELGNKIDNYKR